MSNSPFEIDAVRRTIEFHAAGLEAAFRRWTEQVPVQGPREQYVRLRIDRDITALTDRIATYLARRDDTLPPGPAGANIHGPD